MSKEAVNEVIEKLKSDKEFFKKAEAAGSIEDRIKLFKAEGFDCERDDFLAFQDELSDEALDNVSGGGSWGKFCWVNLFGDKVGCSSGC